MRPSVFALLALPAMATAQPRLDLPPDSGRWAHVMSTRAVQTYVDLGTAERVGHEVYRVWTWTALRKRVEGPDGFVDRVLMLSRFDCQGRRTTPEELVLYLDGRYVHQELLPWGLVPERWPPESELEREGDRVCDLVSLRSSPEK